MGCASEIRRAIEHIVIGSFDVMVEVGRRSQMDTQFMANRPRTETNTENQSSTSFDGVRRPSIPMFLIGKLLFEFNIRHLMNYENNRKRP